MAGLESKRRNSARFTEGAGPNHNGLISQVKGQAGRKQPKHPAPIPCRPLTPTLPKTPPYKTSTPNGAGG